MDVKIGKTHWMERIGGNFSSSPVFANGRVLIMDENGKATWLKTGTQFEVLGTNEVSGRTFATPAFVGASMYMRTDEALIKFTDVGRDKQ